MRRETGPSVVMVTGESIEPAPSPTTCPPLDGAGILSQMRTTAALRSPLVHAALGSLALRAFSLGTGLVGSVALAQLLGVEAYGVFAIVTGWIVLLGVPALLGFDRLLVRELAADGPHRRSAGRELLRTADRAVLGASAFAAIAVAALAWVAAQESAGAGVAILVGAATLPLVTLAQLRQAALQGIHRVLEGQLVEAVVRPLVLLLLAGALLAAGVRQPGPVAGTAMAFAAALAGLVAAVLLLQRAARPAEHQDVREREPATREALRRALPLSVMATMSIVVVQADVVLVGLLATPAAAGVYQVAARGAMLASLPLAVLAAAFAPWFASLWSAGDRAALQRLVSRTTIGATLMSLVIVALLVIAGERFLAIFGPGFEAGTRPLAILTVGWVLNAMLGPTAIVLVMAGREREAALTSAVGIAVEVGLAVLLIPSLGLEGGAIASTAGLLAWSAVLVVVVRRRLGIRPTLAGI